MHFFAVQNKGKATNSLSIMKLNILKQFAFHDLLVYSLFQVNNNSITLQMQINGQYDVPPFSKMSVTQTMQSELRAKTANTEAFQNKFVHNT